MTIAKAIASALAQPEVAEVIVVDDASTDATVSVARTAGRDDHRVRVLVQNANQGPAAARNRAIAESDAPLLAVLDADDQFLPGRFAAILETENWDLCSDNIVFVRNESELKDYSELDAKPLASGMLNLETFVAGNLPARHKQRGELGFLKPVIRRAMLKQFDLRYAPTCRLGEDYLLYLAALAHGARFRIVSSCGYAGLVRNDSLSGRHGIEDLEALLAQERLLLRGLALTDGQRSAVKQHIRSTRRRLVHRQALRARRERGLWQGFLNAARHPSVFADILADRIRPMDEGGLTPRKLLTPVDFDRYTR
ncbi:glycosyltransferase family 2 protein [Sphingomonas qomolangmaensis]|uniref:Glycosyltransferase n=1 Tax=Sphingomonas qomolangmaensis TaxID=2918765 RepID=A0ABY5L6I4_9SPHN|nr:glycosyltransferase [Sphingomonas qomolangmaensis]UUL82392.1 glycosyltransferase [Sphingomonas qomolangmaensis]